MSERRRPRNGGFAARRAVVRWAWRLFRREWRQQVLVLALLTVAVAAAVAGVVAGYNAAATAESRFGTAEQLFRYDKSEPGGLDSRLAKLRQAFGTIDVIGLRRAPIPGAVNTVEVRAQNPHGPYGAPMLRQLSGRYPTGPDDVALTDAVAAIFKVHVGQRVTLGTRTYTVVGTVENPGDLSSEFALVAPAYADPPTTVTVLAAADDAALEAYERTIEVSSVELRSSFDTGQASTTQAVFMFVAIGMLLVCLVAAAGFAVLAHRRLRQLGMISAVGATRRHLRLVLLANGAVVGVAAAVLGAAAGFALWVAAAPVLEKGVSHRVDRFNLPWWQVGVALLLAVVTAVGAAWRPARAAARVPVTQALSARPPQAQPAHRSLVAALLLLALGVCCLWLVNHSLAGIRTPASADQVLIVAGTVATALGMLFLSPPALRVLAALGGRLPVAARLALRDLARHQARSGYALAAISLALAIPVAIVVSASAARSTPAEGNLSDRQIMVTSQSPGVPDRTPAQVASMEARVRQFAATLGNASMVPLTRALSVHAQPQPGTDGGLAWLEAVEVGIKAGPGSFHTVYNAMLYVATPELLRYYGVDGSLSTDVLTTRPRSDLLIFGATQEAKGGSPPPVTAGKLRSPGYTSLPSLLLNPATVERYKLTTVPVGWLLVTDKPLTAEQLAAARELAVATEQVVEYRDPQTELVVVRNTATAVGAVLALAILAMTVGLIRAEAAGDLRTLAAAGASRRIRRALTAYTSGGLALTGAVLGITLAYAALAAGSPDVRDLRAAPVLELAITALGVPLVAAAAGWLLTAREPRSLARPRLE
jgi:putative ABC transport system permease protein